VTELPPIYEALRAQPDFKPLKLEPIVNPCPNILESIDSRDPEAVFRGLWDNDIIDKMVYYTNACAQHTKARPVATTKKAVAAKAAMKATTDNDDDNDDDDVVVV
jgi:hypothetical protein